MFSPERVRQLTAELVACPSISPDPAAESRCAQLLVSKLPGAVEQGTWMTSDGRPVVWALAQGRSSRAVVLLGHYDTVGVDEYTSGPGHGLAFDPEGLRRAWVQAHERDPHAFEARMRADLEDEIRSPGTWMFGRGALDMKSGLAAGLAAFEALAADTENQEGSVLFIAAPDEENESAGMRVVSEALLRMRDERGLDLAGVLNLDYSLEPASYAGVMGKVELGCYLLGRLTHVGAPFDGVDALQLAGEVVSRITHCADLIDAHEDKVGPPPVALGLDDFKKRYTIETATEALVEFNLVYYARPVSKTIEILRREVAAALDESHRTMVHLAEQVAGKAQAQHLAKHAPIVLTYDELVQRVKTPEVGHASDAGGDPRRATVARLRRLIAVAGLRGPAAVLHLLPPFYPNAQPSRGALTDAVTSVLGQEDDVKLDAFYPYITDASYVAWRGESYEDVARNFPSLGREYDLPCKAITELDLDVVNLGPWGRDPHGVYERVFARDAFERLPVWLDRIIRAVWRNA